MKAIVIALMIQFSFGIHPSPQTEAEMSKEKEAIRNIVERHYIDVLYYGKDIAELEKAFHPEFNMYVLQENKIDKRPLQQWLDRLRAVRSRKTATADSDEKTRYSHEFKTIDVTGYTAVTKFEIYYDGKLKFTDYLTLHKFDEGWRVMAKFFTQH